MHDEQTKTEINPNDVSNLTNGGLLDESQALNETKDEKSTKALINRFSILDINNKP